MNQQLRADSRAAATPPAGIPADLLVEGPLGGPLGRMTKRIGGERIAFALVWLGALVYFSAALPGSYLTIGNISTMLSSQSNLLILALATILPLTAGDFDLSIAGVAGLSSITVGVLNVTYGLPITVAVVAAMLVGVAIGFVNYVLVVVTGADSIVVTLGMATFLGGVNLWLTNSSIISGVSPELINAVILFRILGIPVVFYYALILCVVLWYIMSYTVVGRRLLFIGQNREVARLSGIRVDKLRAGALIAGSFIASLAGIVSVGVSGAADPANAPALLLPAFAAAFLGSAALGRGRFGAWSCFAAVYFLVCGITGLQHLGAQSYVQSLFYGAALVVAVTIAAISGRRRRNREQNRAASAA